MRAVARGMVLEALPACPERCGGPRADLAALPDAVRRHREQHGCDSPIPDGGRLHYMIRCPRCDGAGQHTRDCSLCGDGPAPGFYAPRRCPASHGTPDVMSVVSACSMIRRGFLPEAGGVADQAAQFMDASRIFEAEVNEATEEQRKEGG